MSKHSIRGLGTKEKAPGEWGVNWLQNTEGLLGSVEDPFEVCSHKFKVRTVRMWNLNKGIDQVIQI